MSEPLDILVLPDSESVEDVALQAELRAHLEPLARAGLVRIAPEASAFPERPFVGLLLTSPDLAARPERWRPPLTAALERQNQGRARVIPILLRAHEWAGTPVADLPPLPADGQPLTNRTDREAAWRDVARSIKAIAVRGYLGLAPAAPAPPPAVPAPAAAPPVPFNVPLPENPAFVGREEELARIEAFFLGADAPAHSYRDQRYLVLGGPPGSGKTELACAHVRRHRDAYPGGVFWLDASQDQQTAFAALQAQLPPPEDPRLPPDDVQVALSKRQGWLLVIDAADAAEDPHWLSHFLLVFNGETPPRVLITTRGGGYLHDATSLWVGPLGEDQGATLLRSARATFDASTAARISRALDGLPAALEIAAGYLRTNPRVSPEAFLERIEAAASEAPDRRDLRAQHAHRAAMGACVEALSPASRDLLRAAVAFGGDAALPRFRLAQLTGLEDSGPEAPFAVALAELGRASLLARAAKEGHVKLRPGTASLAELVFGRDDAFASALLARVARAFVDLGALHRAMQARGFAATRADLRAFGRPRRGSAPPLLAALHRTLEGEAPRLEKWDPASGPGPLLVQLRDGAFELGIAELLERAEAALREAGRPWLRRRTYIEPSPPRLLGHHDGDITAIALSADEKRALSASEDGTARAWDLERRTILAELRGHAGPLRAAAMTPDGRLAVTASDDHTLIVWEVDTGDARCTLHGHLAGVLAVALTSNGRRCVSAAEDGFAYIWDTATGRPLRSLRAEPNPGSRPPHARAVAVTPDDRLAVLALSDGSVQLFDLDEGRLVRKLDLGLKTAPSLATTRDRVLAVARSEDGNVQYHDLERGFVAYILGEHAATKPGAPSTSLAPSGEVAACSAPGSIVQLWDPATGQLVRALAGHTGEVLATALGAQGRLVISGGKDWTVRTWDALRGPVPQHAWRVVALAVTADGKRAVSGSIDGTLAIWDIAAGRPLRTLHLGAAPHAVVASTDGLILAITANWTAQTWDPVTGQCLRSLSLRPPPDASGPPENVRPAHRRSTRPPDILEAVITADGRLAVVTVWHDDTRTLHSWDLAEGKHLRAESMTARQFNRAIVAGNRLLRLERDARQVVDVASGEVLPLLSNLLPASNTQVAARDGNRLFFTTQEGVGVVDLDTDRLLCTLASPRTSALLQGRDATPVPTPDGRFLLILGGDVATVWDVEANHLVATLALPFQGVTAGTLTPDGRTLIIASVRTIMPPPEPEGWQRRPLGAHLRSREVTEPGQVHFVDLVG